MSKNKRLDGVELLRRQAAMVAANFRRVMERDALSLADVAAATGLDPRTLRAILRCANTSHPRTLHKLARGLGISVDELMLPAGGWRRFIHPTTPLIDRVVAAHRESFAGWSDADFDVLYDRLDTGREWTEDGVLAAVDKINAQRELWRRVNIILESGEAELCVMIVKFLYGRVTARATS